MRNLRTVALVLALVAAACGGGDDDAGNNDDAGGSGAGGGNDPTIMSTDFDLSDLPDEFPDSYVPPSWTAGQATDLLGPEIVNFESDSAFDDIVDYYRGVFGEPNQLAGDPGEQLAQWFDDPTWVLSIFDGDPVLIGFAELEE
ncbi:MAG: hypothetical protein HKN91_01540 [Acidimicrobiia bacterium]|nr:hypothetical protein [Acidimicrobiia bacterium]